MSRKHLVKYYDDVCKQYNDFIEEIKDFEECVEKGVVSPETIENIKSMLEPLKNNWQTLNYVMYLLNMPNKKDKIDKYNRQNNGKLKTCKTDTEVKEENKKCIKDMQEFTNDVRSKI